MRKLNKIIYNNFLLNKSCKTIKHGEMFVYYQMMYLWECELQKGFGKKMNSKEGFGKKWIVKKFLEKKTRHELMSKKN